MAAWIGVGCEAGGSSRRLAIVPWSEVTAFLAMGATTVRARCVAAMTG
ncbi:MAG: hypothetical protein MRJ92_09110 [Nitrospira sp.]|nr:hypothetical protein [Nitrospira sp.]